ncbi:MAG: transporter [Cyclobacteriaceae bacterium]|nr:transporter [Cyclobacteriaceae bacterium]
MTVGLENVFQIFNNSFGETGQREISPIDLGPFSPKSVVRNKQVNSLSLTYGITNRLQIKAALPVVLYKERSVFVVTENDSLSMDKDYFKSLGVNAEREGNGFGDATVDVSFQLLQESNNKLGVRVGLTSRLPTGRKDPVNIVDENNYTIPSGAGETVFIPNISARLLQYPYSHLFSVNYEYSIGGKKKFPPYRFYLNYNPGFSTIDYFYQSPPIFHIDYSFNFHLNDWMAISNSLSYNRQKAKTTVLVSYWKEIEVPDSWAMVYTNRISFQVKKYRINQVINVPLKGKNRPADVSYGLEMQYTF